MKLFRPNLTNQEILKFKKDVKLLARHVSNEAGLIHKLQTTFSQNQFSKAMGFSSFSELRLNENKYKENTTGFDLLSDIEIKDIFEAYKDKGISIEQASNGLGSARESLRITSMPTISLEDMLPIINKSQFSEHQYKIDDEEPTEFRVCKTDEFFDQLMVEDQFILSMPNNGIKYYYTVVNSFPYIYDKSIKVYTVRRGLWVALSNGGFCSGAEVRGFI
jgi:hypothetical protein